MNNWIGYTIKILLWSLLGSLLLKYAAPWLQLSPTSTHVVLGVVLLPLAMVIALVLRQFSLV
jgi:hypothetical protein